MVPLDMDFEVLNGPKSFPANRGFPAFSFGAEVEHNGSMLLCSFGGEVGPGVSHTFSDKAWVTVHGEYCLVQLEDFTHVHILSTHQMILSLLLFVGTVIVISGTC